MANTSVRPSALHMLAEACGGTTALAKTLGVVYCKVSDHLAGRVRNLSPEIEAALDTAGYDGQAIARDFHRWAQESASAGQAALRDVLRRSQDPVLAAIHRDFVKSAVGARGEQ